MSLVLPLVVIVLGGIAGALSARHMRGHGVPDGTSTASGSPAVARYRRWIAVGVVAGSVTVVLGVLLLTGPGMGLVLAPAVFAVVVLTTSALAVATVRPRQGARRRAPLDTGTLRSTAGPVHLAVALTTVAVTAGVLVVGILTGSPDDLGRPGQAVTVFCAADDGLHVISSTPWPGIRYSVPLLTVLAICTLIVLGALILATKRPVLPDPEADAAFRGLAGRTVTCTLTFTAAVTGAPIALGMLSAYPDCAGTPFFLWAVAAAGVLLVCSAVFAVGQIGAALTGRILAAR
ncbi:hypothetical protein [Corynebacterium pygosceleis]|uniref:Uncharacterized protein n=1 Tax=Corynebacterium pygosceleis TaxID=2800406 RepID=A0A9Q4C9J8_9CORY|nr:hypothetical protein [Corynebacterium pygosceleis]MCK7638399.1 hypothetical protein [Corynebacterium pygosceleis]MCK7675379.1 hypothetical protein [Corynebacterium pygosceleis]MCL0121227.1 hypothetical protein [Corynebacterium pygosceleis]MCX7469062.1 hypothetical protein [Corynebacterium pygosceleis]